MLRRVGKEIKVGEFERKVLIKSVEYGGGGNFLYSLITTLWKQVNR